VKSDPTFWILARASGLTAYALITVSVLAGIVLKSRPFGTRVKPAAITDVHRFLALLALAAVAVHGAALVFDSTVRIDLLGLVVPGRISYRPIWTGAGIVGAELALLIYVSFSVRKIIRVKNWRRLHWLTYGVFVAITAHGLLGGSDSGTAWARYFYLSTIGSVCFAAAWRALTRAPVRRRQPGPATARGAIAPAPADA
jgi:sulfoxide reductase heme-binding subunit YedZ